ncbi:MAG: endolytic transglycosylase MltG [Bdellovibrionota bacterium]
MKKIFYIFLSFLLAFLIFVLGFLFFGYRYLKVAYENKILNVSKAQITLSRGEPLKKFSKKLKDNNVIDNELFFYLWVRFFSDYSKYQSGPYLFDGYITPKIIDEMITKGKIYEPIVFKITIPEGYNFRQICEKINSLDNTYEFDDCYSLFKDKKLLEKYNIESPTLEGFLYPLTYSFTEVPTIREIIQKMLDTFFEKLPKDYIENISKLNLSLKDAVTFASLIELESADPKEREIISGVIWNRLNAKMPLGIDASLIYGIKDYKGNISSKDLKDSKNKFNTRMFLGLPPTPIASPSLESLLAVISPKEHKFYYYVLNYENKNEHIFSRNLREHNIHVRNLVKSYKKRK